MSNRFLDVLHAENAEIICQLGELRKLIRALDTIGMDGLSSKIWSISNIINDSNKNILDAYGKELQADFIDSQRAIGDTLRSILKPIANAE